RACRNTRSAPTSRGRRAWRARADARTTRHPGPSPRARSFLSPRENILEHDAVDLAVHADSHVVVLPVHEVRERFEEDLIRGALRRRQPLLLLIQRLPEQNRLQLLHDVGGDGHQIFRLRREEVELVKAVEPVELADGIGIVVDTDIDVAVVVAQVTGILADYE